MQPSIFSPKPIEAMLAPSPCAHRHPNDVESRGPCAWRLIEPEEIANAAAFLASPTCGYVSGTVLDVDGGGAFRG